MSEFDYIIVGAGSAGCVLAERLSENPANQVLLVEAGPKDDNPLIHMPKGLGKLLGNPSYAWQYAVEPESGNGYRNEGWVRGKMLGGSSSINGMLYTRGQPADYDDWESMGCKGWGWKDIVRGFRAVEGHELGGNDYRGGNGPLKISTAAEYFPACDAFINAGAELGLETREDINQPNQEGIGYAPRTIDKGRRQSAAVAFLKPAYQRSNLKVITDSYVEKIEFENLRACAVQCRTGTEKKRYKARREIILSAGAIESPVLLQRSGIGQSEQLAALGIEVVSDLPGVGRNMREHFLFAAQFRVSEKRLSHNNQYSGLNLVLNVLRYMIGRKGLLASTSHEAVAFVRTRPELDRPDAQIVMAPFSADLSNADMVAFEKAPGIQIFGYPMRPESRGSVLICDREPSVSPVIRPNYMTAEYDRSVAVNLLKYIRSMAATPSLAGIIEVETHPGPSVKTDQQILEMFSRYGQSGYHAAGTCAMGDGPDSVVDADLRVKGVKGLRVMDCSVMPTLVSSNTNAPVMAMAWLAAKRIMADRV